MDINKVWLAGLCDSQPVLTKLPSKTPFVSFLLQVNEQYNDRNGVAQQKPNTLRIETLGKNTELVMQKVKQGQRFYVDGYLRQEAREGGDLVKVRTFAVYKEETNDKLVYNEGLKQALDVIRRSRDIQSAVATLEELIAAG